MLLSPQAERNWEGLCEVLEDVLEDQSHKQLFALELGSGTGQHVIRFAQRLPFVTWQPSDIKEECRNRFVSHLKNNNFAPFFITSTVKSDGMCDYFQHSSIYSCNPCENCAAASPAGCQGTLGQMGRCFS